MGLYKKAFFNQIYPGTPVPINVPWCTSVGGGDEGTLTLVPSDNDFLDFNY